MTERKIRNGRPAKEPASVCREFMKQLAYTNGMTMQEFCEKIGTTGQAFGKHTQIGHLTWNELKTIADALGYKVEVSFTCPYGVSYSREYDGQKKDGRW